MFDPICMALCCGGSDNGGSSGGGIRVINCYDSDDPIMNVVGTQMSQLVLNGGGTLRTDSDAFDHFLNKIPLDGQVMLKYGVPSANMVMFANASTMMLNGKAAQVSITDTFYDFSTSTTLAVNVVITQLGIVAGVNPVTISDNAGEV